MLDLSGLFLNRNPIAKIQIFPEISKSCPEFCAVFSCVFSVKLNPRFSCSKMLFHLKSASPPLQVRFKSVLRNGLRAKAQRRENGGTT